MTSKQQVDDANAALQQIHSYYRSAYADLIAPAAISTDPPARMTPTSSEPAGMDFKLRRALVDCSRWLALAHKGFMPFKPPVKLWLPFNLDLRRESKTQTKAVEDSDAVQQITTERWVTSGMDRSQAVIDPDELEEAGQRLTAIMWWALASGDSGVQRALSRACNRVDSACVRLLSVVEMSSLPPEEPLRCSKCQVNEARKDRRDCEACHSKDVRKARKARRARKSA